jgi:hypothetical protein
MMGTLYMLVAGVSQPQNRRHIHQPVRKEEQTKNVHHSHQVRQPSTMRNDPASAEGRAGSLGVFWLLGVCDDV